MIIDTGLVILGFGLLYFGAEGLVRGSSSLASRLGMSSLAIGLTIVAYGTSMPEMVVSIEAATKHQGAISVGNVIGSNIFNIAMILGLSAVIRPLKARLKIVKIDAPIMIGTGLVFLLMFSDFHISRLEAGILFAGAISYTIFNLIAARKAGRSLDDSGADKNNLPSLAMEISFIIAGLALLALGSNFLLKGSVGIARTLGISEAVIGLTIIAAGTSLPELATSAIAALRKESDIAIANIIGSNIFNILSILGVSALIMPIDAAGIRMVDIIVMLALSLCLLPFLRTGYVLGRIEGALLLTCYVVFMGYLLIF